MCTQTCNCTLILYNCTKAMSGPLQIPVYSGAYKIRVVFPRKGWTDCTSRGKKKTCAGHIECIQASSPLTHSLRSAEAGAGLKISRSCKKLQGLLQSFRCGTMFLVLSGCGDA